MKERIQEAITKALSEAGVSDLSFTVERPADFSHGDYATNVALLAAKELNTNPKAAAEKFIPAIERDLDTIASKVEIAGPGFINITLTTACVTDAVTQAVTQKEAWGKHTDAEGRRVIIEYTNTNAFKEMHIGHLMSNVIGEAIARLTESRGATVLRDTYGGDVGPHVAKAIWALQKGGIIDPESAEQVGDAYAKGSRAYEEDAKAKAEIDAINQEIYEGKDAALMELWRKGRDASLSAFEVLYRILGTKFDYYFFESETSAPGLRLVRDGLKKGIFEESEGAVVYKGEAEGLHTLVFITSMGTPTYEAKDIGLAFLREERVQTDESLIITASEQIGHFKIVLAALAKLAPIIAAKTMHVSHGLLRLTSGKMSSREGNVITARELIANVITAAGEKNADPLIAEQVAVGAIKYMILRQSPGTDIIFDPEKSLSLEGDSGPYLQYALVRACSVIEKSDADSEGADRPEESFLLERILVHFPEIVARASVERVPNLLVTYLTELAGEWNSFYAKERIVGGEYEAYKVRVARAFVQTMQNGLSMLGIPTPEKM